MIAVLNALARILDAIAWPSVAAIALGLFRSEFASLLTRIRKGAGAEFDPPQQPTGSAPNFLRTTDLPITGETTAALPFPRTPATQEFENLILAYPPIASATDLRDRVNILTTLSARAILVGIFRQVEATIWASQVSILEHLNGTLHGATYEDIQRDYYQPAKETYPERFANYSYDSYLAFLANSGFVTTSERRVTITDRGTEYLAWRIESKQVRKQFG